MRPRLFACLNWELYIVTDEKYYASESIKCKDGSKFFNKARINDNFCDCVDGTDEPGNNRKNQNLLLLMVEFCNKFEILNAEL